MNHIADKAVISTVADERQDERKSRGAYLVVAAMLGYSLLLYGHWGESFGSGSALLTAAITYFFAMYVYYGIARLAYQRYTYPLWGGAVAALIAAYLLSGASGIWVVLTGWSMLLFAGVLSGRLTLANYLQGRIYIASATTVAVLFTLQSLPMWGDFVKAAPQLGDAFTQQWEQFMVGMGYGSDTIRESLHQSRRLFDVMVRLFPAATILGALLQFTIGYLAFVLWVSRNDRSSACYVPFVYWKIPFGLTPVLIILILMRSFGGETWTMIADNGLTVLAVYYCVAGLALIEYYLSKLCVSRLMKTLFYILLFLTQLAGFFVATLVGFVDSFANWRKVHTQKAV